MKTSKHIWLVVALVMMSLNAVKAGGEDKFRWFFVRGLQESRPDLWSDARVEFEDLVVRLEEKREKTKSDEAFLRYVFYSVHRKYLGEYKQYVALGEIFDKRRQYDCVTGTALYALVLDYFGFRYEIRETDYHVYLMAYADGQKFLIESTDALYGITKDPKEIEARHRVILDDAGRVNAQIAMQGLGSKHSKSVAPTAVIDKAVTLEQLAGLHYYNLALDQLNAQNYSESFKLVSKAYQIYPSERIKQTASLVFALAFGD